MKFSSLSELHRPVIVDFISRVLSLFLPNLKAAILFGSVARGDATAESDIDLLLIFTDVNDQLREDILTIADDLLLVWGVVLMPKLCTLAWWLDMAEGPYPLFNEIFKDGIPVYGEPVIFAPLAHRDVPPLYDTAVTA